MGKAQKKSTEVPEPDAPQARQQRKQAITKTAPVRRIAVKEERKGRWVRILLTATSSELEQLDSVVEDQLLHGGSLTNRGAVLWYLLDQHHKELLNKKQIKLL